MAGTERSLSTMLIVAVVVPFIQVPTTAAAADCQLILGFAMRKAREFGWAWMVIATDVGDWIAHGRHTPGRPRKQRGG